MKTRLALIVIALSAMICASAYAGLTDGLVSAWLFNDGTAKDLTGKNDGIIHGATKAAGKYGSSLSFNGVDNYVEIPDSPSLHLPEGLTVAAWMNVKVGVDHGAVCWKGEKIGWGPNFSWRVATTSDTDMTWGRCPAGIEGWFATNGVTPATNQWVHVALTSNAPGAATPMRCYVNGEDKTGVSGQTGMNEKPPYLVFEGVPVEIGVGRGHGGTVGNDKFFNGLIDEVVIYDRGLTQNEIKELMGADLSTITAVDPAGKIASVWGKIKGE